MLKALVLCFMLYAMIPLFAQVPHYSFTEIGSIESPMGYMDYIYECETDSSAHFYNRIIEDGVCTFYHYSLNSQFEFSPVTAIFSYSVTSQWSSNFRIIRLSNSNTVHAVLQDESSHDKYVLRLENFNQLTGTIDIQAFGDNISYSVSPNESTIVVWDINRDAASILDWYREFYIYDFDTGQVNYLTRRNRYTEMYKFNAHLYLKGVGVDTTYVDTGLTIFDEDMTIVTEHTQDSPDIDWNAASIGLHHRFDLANGTLYSQKVGDLYDPCDPISIVFATSDELVISTLDYWCLFNSPCKVSDTEFVAFYKEPEHWSTINLARYIYNGADWSYSQSSESLPFISDYILCIDDYLITLVDTQDLGNCFYVLDRNMNHVHTYDSGSLNIFNSALMFMFNNHIAVSQGMAMKLFDFEVTSPISETDLVPNKSITVTNYPNPFNPETTILYNIPESGEVEISIYNLKGQLINTLISEFQAKGEHSIVWNGTDNENNTVATGVYLSVVKTENEQRSNKMLLMK